MKTLFYKPKTYKTYISNNLFFSTIEKTHCNREFSKLKRGMLFIQSNLSLTTKILGLNYRFCGFKEKETTVWPIVAMPLCTLGDKFINLSNSISYHFKRSIGMIICNMLLKNRFCKTHFATVRTCKWLWLLHGQSFPSIVKI